MTAEQEWKDLPDLQWVATAQAEEWEIQIQTDAGNDKYCPFKAWDGRHWNTGYLFRGRPRQPAMKKVKLEAWLSEYELRWLNVEAGNKPAPLWIRVQSEDKTVEVPV